MQQMKARLVTLTVVVVATVFVAVAVAAQKAGTAAAMFEAARQKETVEGDLAGAIKQYQGVVDRFGKADRAVAARALVRMAECYEKLGDAQARPIYERVLKEYGEQGAAVTQARTRLGLAGPASVDRRPASRQLWAGPKVRTNGRISPDGRYLSFSDGDETWALALHEFATGTDRRLTTSGYGEGSAERSVISPDGLQVAYAWHNLAKEGQELRVVRVATAGRPTPRILIENQDIRYIVPHDWSPDGNWIALEIGRADRTAQLALVATDSGEVKVLKSVDWRGTSRIAFSADSRLVAYDLPVSDDSVQRDVFVLSIDGSRETAAVAHPARDIVVGWSPDGSSLLFASDRSGSTGLWALPMENGTPRGAASLIRPDLGPFLDSLGITQSGGLVFSQKTGARKVYTAVIDLATGRLVSPPTEASETYLYNQSAPAWSLDGRSIAFTSGLDGTTRFGAHAISIQSNETRRAIDVAPKMGSILFPRWAPDGSIVCQGSDLKARQGIYRIDAATGDSSLIVGGEGGTYLGHPSLSSDGRILVYRRTGPKDAAIMIRDLAGMAGRELIRRDNGRLGFFRVSPNGRLVAYMTGDLSSGWQTMNVISTDGGDARELFRLGGSASFTNLVEWTPDSRNLVFGKSENRNVTGWVVPVLGGAPVQLDPALPERAFMQSLRIHPDGRRIAFDAGQSSIEVWSLENFLPATTAKK